MSSAKARNFRRRAGGYDDADEPSATIEITPKPSFSKPKKPTLSFADDEELPFSIQPTKTPSSSRPSGRSSSAHKLTSSRDRIARPPPSNLSLSNAQPSYSKEDLLALQKNTKTLAGRTPKPKPEPEPEPEPILIMKGSLKPQVPVGELEVETYGEIQSSVEKDEVFDRLGKARLGSGSKEGDGLMMDQAAIERIKAKRERLRQVKAAAPDYISLDGGSNHGEAEGLSDEEPEFQQRIGFFGEKVAGQDDKKGVFEEFEEKATRKDNMIESGSDDDDEDGDEERWEEEQVRKGLGKRLDDAVVGSRQSDAVQSFGYLITGAIGVNSQVQNVRSNRSIGGAVGGDVMTIAQRAEGDKKALQDNLKRAKESHDRTKLSLAKTEENLAMSLENITALEISRSAAGKKFVFMQGIRDFVSVLCDFLQHKTPIIEELEEQVQKLHEKRAKAIAERRSADNDDEASEIEPAMVAARAEFRKAGSNAAKVAAATAAAQAVFANANAFKSTPMEVDEFGRDLNLQKRQDAKRRAEARQKRRAKADSKRKLSMENGDSFQQMEGELSTDESDNENSAYGSTRTELLKVAKDAFSDASEEYSQFSMVIEKFERWKKDYASSYRDAYMSVSILNIFAPYVRLELLKWDPLHEDSDFFDMKWHSLLVDYSLPEDDSMSNENDADADADAKLIPSLVEKLALPMLHHQLEFCWDMFSTRGTKYAVSAVKLVIGYGDIVPLVGVEELVAVVHDRLTNAVADLKVPTWSPLEMNAVPNSARTAAYKFGTSVRLLRNICLWSEILAPPALEKLALDGLLYGKVLPHLFSIYSDVHDAITRTERVIASLYGVWAGQSVSGDRRKLQPLVEYLMLIGKTLEKKYASGAMETENSKLVRRLKKMLVDLNEYDHARALSRTFNLKEAL